MEASKTRFDYEGMADVDVECNTSTELRRFRDGLDMPSRTAFNIWRGGAVRTPMRRWYNRAGAPPTAEEEERQRLTDDPQYLAMRERCRCRACGAMWASAAHYFVDCPELDATRRALEAEYGLDAGWWAQQPAVTTKSSWVVYQAARTRKGRLKCLLAAVQLGIAIVRSRTIDGDGDDVDY
jgi:hypothetical protein